MGVPNLQERLMAPSLAHPFGTDDLGRDLLARCLFGLRSTLLVGFSVVGISLVIGVIVGVVAGFFGGWVDEVIMRTTDIFLAFPGFLLAVTLAMIFSPGTTSAIIALSVTWWPWYARIARAEAASVRERDFVRAARTMGVSDAQIISRHIAPNVMIPTQVQATQDLGAAILAGASLGFLGLGTQAPTADLGRMINEARIGLLVGDWWLIVFPGALVYLAVIAAISAGDALQSSTGLK
jgi:peptide/nickel transport system permease protein